MFCPSCLLFYVKWPEQGEVKTRLAKDLDDEIATGLYRCFILDMLDTIQRSGIPVIICHSPPESEDSFREWLGDTFSFHPQSSGDLGHRLHLSFEEAFEQGFTRVCVVGSDVPTLPAQVLQQAFRALQDHGSVLGPSPDGGYYLIGFRPNSFTPRVFQGIPWSSSQVLPTTLRILGDQGTSVATLEEIPDMDTLEILLAWLRRTKKQPEAGGLTWQFSQELARSRREFRFLLNPKAR